ncbi:MAG: YebC/PmpR family DNA-binding transcriptional regulator [Candidatus Moraniibacteriota bacterium]|nr:MAG: YebC/PmpR family DNA-binding transcriptional regulator [Candidatus Moranbacteria bacterium]
MSGHSHWHGIRHKKAITDAKRASVFTKFGKLITIAAKDGGGDVSMNVRLRLLVDQARSANMPKENIERAIKRGTGELKEGGDIQEIVYEGLIPVSAGQISLMILVATDNKNRAVSEIKTFLKKSGGQMVPNGSVGYLFDNVGIIELSQDQVVSQEDLEMIIIDAGASDIEIRDDVIIVYTEIKNLKTTQENLVKKNISILSSTIGYRSTQKISLSDEEYSRYETLLEQFDEQEDVQNIYDNI